MISYDVTAYRDGKWWVFEIPALASPSPRGEGHQIVAMGQARTAGEVTEEARSLAALWTETEETDIEVTVSYRVPEEVQTAMEEANSLDATGRAALDNAAKLRRRAVSHLRSYGLSQADSAAVLGLSRQRVQQLESSK